jgi:hypothetical protein
MPHRAKNGSNGSYFSDSTPDFPPKCRHFGHPFAIVLHLFGLKMIETLTINRFYSYSASPIYTGLFSLDKSLMPKFCAINFA